VRATPAGEGAGDDERSPCKAAWGDGGAHQPVSLASIGNPESLRCDCDCDCDFERNARPRAKILRLLATRWISRVHVR